MDTGALLLSLKLALATTLVLAVLGVPLAAWLAFTRSRLRFLVEPLVALPLVLPPTVLGFFLLVALAPRSPVGRFLDESLGLRLPFTFWGLLVASVFYSLPFAVQPFATAFAAVDGRLLEASATLGASRLGTFRRVVLPLSARGFVTGCVLAFAHTLGEFGVVLMVGGNLPGETRTAALAIYDDVQALDYESAFATSAVLLVFSFAVLATTYALTKRTPRAWPPS